MKQERVWTHSVYDSKIKTLIYPLEGMAYFCSHFKCQRGSKKSLDNSHLHPQLNGPLKNVHRGWTPSWESTLQQIKAKVLEADGPEFKFCFHHLLAA